MCSFPPGHRGRRDGDGLSRTKAGHHVSGRRAEAEGERAPARLASGRRHKVGRSGGDLRLSCPVQRVAFRRRIPGIGVPCSWRDDPVVRPGHTEHARDREPDGTTRCMKAAGEPWEGRPTEESELIERAQRGDAMAYEDLVRRHQDAALRTAGLVLAGAAETEDAVQDAFVKAYAALGRFRAGSAFRPWILRIVANEARNRRRSAGRRAGLALRLAEDRPSDGAAPSPGAARRSPRGARRAERRRPARPRLPLLPGAGRGRDGRGAGDSAGNREVAPVQGAGASAPRDRTRVRARPPTRHGG